MIKRGCILRAYLAVFFAFILSLSFVAATGYTTSQPSHATLYANTLRGKSGGNVMIQDVLNVSSDAKFSADFGEQLIISSTVVSPTKPALRLYSRQNLIAADIYGLVSITAPGATSLNVVTNRSAAGTANTFWGRSYVGAILSGAPEREVMLTNNTFAVWGATDDGYHGWIAGLNPFAVGKAGVAGRASATRGGSLGTSNYGVYGQYSSTIYGYLGGVSYGAFGEYDATHYGYLGSSTLGAYGRGSNGVRGDNDVTTNRYGLLGAGAYGVYGTYDSTGTVNGYLGGASYGAYGQNTASIFGYLGGAIYGAYAQQSATIFGYMGGASYAVYGRSDGVAGVVGRTDAAAGYGIYGYSSTATGYSGYFSGGQGVQIPIGGLCVDSDGSCDPDASGVGWVRARGYFTGAADLAEHYNSNEKLEAGDVVVISGKLDVQKSSKPFDTLAAGIVSESPGIKLGENEGGYPIALSGRVPVKASAENGGIAMGDLLTTSSSPGYAMKCKRTDDCFGAVLGKALEPLSSGKGKILVLVALG